MNTAVLIYPRDGIDQYEKVLGLTLLERSVFTAAQLTGTDTVHVPTRADPEFTMRGIRVVSEFPADCDEIILMDPAFIGQKKLLFNLRDNFSGTIAACDEGSLSPLGFARVQIDDMDGRFREDPWGYLAVLAEQRRDIRVAMVSRQWVYVRDENDLRHAEDLIMSNLTRDSDGIIAKNFNRVFSLFITRITSPLRIPPLVWTLVSFITGLYGSWNILAGDTFSEFVGFLFIQCSSILSGVDGETARLHLKTSESGKWCNTVSDDLVVWSFFTALTVVSGEGTYIYKAGEILMVAYPLYVLLKYVSMIRSRWNRDEGVFPIRYASSDSPESGDNDFARILILFMKRDFVIFFGLVLSFFGYARVFAPLYLLLIISLTATAVYRFVTDTRS